MLALSRKVQEGITIFDKKTKRVIARIVLLNIDRNKIRVGIESDPGTIAIYRDEIIPSMYTEAHHETPPGR